MPAPSFARSERARALIRSKKRRFIPTAHWPRPRRLLFAPFNRAFNPRCPHLNFFRGRRPRRLNRLNFPAHAALQRSRRGVKLAAMASDYDATEFVDGDFQAAQKSPYATVSATTTHLR